MTSSARSSVSHPADVVPLERIESRIYLIRGNKVLIDRDLAEMYGVETRVLNQAVGRHLDRFPDDFMFELSRDEIRNLSQIVIGSGIKHAPRVRVFTEQGVVMLSGILHSSQAIAVNITVMRAFVRLRQLIAGQADLARKLRSLERKYDEQFKVVFDAIRELMSPAAVPPERELGFHTARKSSPSKKTKA